jgi:hypothetical protein
MAAARVPIIPSPGASVEARAAIMPTAAQLPDGAVLGAAIVAIGTKARRKRECIFAACSDIKVRLAYFPHNESLHLGVSKARHINR